ncbi:ubiquitin-specific protease ESD4 [Trifolium repens]|nr:ubiquitin-specific protease ESD4 [Trifolium repens]
MDMNIPRKKASGKWVWIKDSETDVVDTQDGQSHDSLYELVSCVESASNKIQIKIAMENSKNKKSTISTPSPSNKSATKSSTPTKHPNILVSLPSEIKCTFPPTRAMHLQMADIQLCAYVFNAEHDPNEVMIQIGGYTVSRMELHCMCPNEVVKDQIFNLMAMKTTWSQYNAVNKTVWSLPPTFAEDVKYGHNLESLATTYSTNFMSPFTTLKYIYVPSKDEGGHWFLMVISIKDKIVYHLDSFLQPQNIATRREIISKLCKVIAELVLTDKYPNNYLNGSTDFGDWEIKEPRGMPNNGSRNVGGPSSCTPNWYKTTIVPDKEAIYVCPYFLNNWSTKLDYEKHGFIINSYREKTKVKFIWKKGKLCLSSGITVAANNGYTQQTKVIVYFEGQNNFLMFDESWREFAPPYDVPAEPVTICCSDDETYYETIIEPGHGGNDEVIEPDNDGPFNDEVIELDQDDNEEVIEHDHDGLVNEEVIEPDGEMNNSNCFVWDKIVGKEFAKGKQVLHFPAHVCKACPDIENQIIFAINAQTHQNIQCKVIKARRKEPWKAKVPEFHLGGLWFDFVKRLNIKSQDTLKFHLDMTTRVLTVVIVRKQNAR